MAQRHAAGGAGLARPGAGDDESHRATEEITYCCLLVQRRPPVVHLLGAEHMLVAQPCHGRGQQGAGGLECAEDDDWSTDTSVSPASPNILGNWRPIHP